MHMVLRIVYQIYLYIGDIPHQMVTKDILNTHFNQLNKRTNIYNSIYQKNYLAKS